MESLTRRIIGLRKPCSMMISQPRNRAENSSRQSTMKPARMNRLLRNFAAASGSTGRNHRRQLVIEPVDCCTLPPLLSQKLAPQLKSKELQFCQSASPKGPSAEVNRNPPSGTQ